MRGGAQTRLKLLPENVAGPEQKWGSLA